MRWVVITPAGASGRGPNETSDDELGLWKGKKNASQLSMISSQHPLHLQMVIEVETRNNESEKWKQIV